MTGLSSTTVTVHVLPWSVDVLISSRPPAPATPGGVVGPAGLLGSAGGVRSRVKA